MLFSPLVGFEVGVYIFGKISMAHFNPAATLSFPITGHIKEYQLLHYFIEDIIEAFFASPIIKYFIRYEGNLGANVPNHTFLLPLLFGIKVLPSALLMIAICIVVYARGLRGFGGIAIGNVVGLDILFLYIYFWCFYQSC